jgi:hypothetical protein
MMFSKFSSCYNEAQDQDEINLIEMNQVFANRSEDEEIYPLTVKEIVEAQKADTILTHFFKSNAVLSKGLELQLVETKGVCVYLFSGFRRQCFNYAIPIAKSYPPMTSLPYLGLVVLPLRTPRGGGFSERGFQLVRVSWLGLRGNCWKAVPQPRNSSHQVFITASVERAVLT